MKKLISPTFAANLSIVFFIMLLIMHIFIILKILPSSFVWAGQISDDAKLFKLESIAIIILIIFLSIFIVKKRLMQNNASQKMINIFMWITSIWFLWNVFANMYAATALEKLLFIPISTIFCLMSLRLAIER